jgi:hypothetical protein
MGTGILGTVLVSAPPPGIDATPVRQGAFNHEEPQPGKRINLGLPCLLFQARWLVGKRLACAAEQANEYG